MNSPRRWEKVLAALRTGAILRFFPVPHGTNIEHFTAWRLIIDGRTEPVGHATIKLLTTRGLIRRVENQAVLTVKGARC